MGSRRGRKYPPPLHCRRRFWVSAHHIPPRPLLHMPHYCSCHGGEREREREWAAVRQNSRVFGAEEEVKKIPGNILLFSVEFCALFGCSFSESGGGWGPSIRVTSSFPEKSFLWATTEPDTSLPSSCKTHPPPCC